jgi:2-phospho-L-lactate guanylyltransferase
VILWSVVVPVKRRERAKTRLRATLPGADHDALVLAMALDTVAAALACPAVGQVLVVTDDPVAAPALEALGAVCVPDTPDAGLNPALAHGAAEAASRAPSWGVAVLGSDLPALRPAELAAALAAGPAGSRGFVADAAGVGTTLLAAAPGIALRPAYGPGSAAAHAAAGATPLVGGWPSLRRDVDTADDLTEATRLGVGRHTADALRAHSGEARRGHTGDAERRRNAGAQLEPAPTSNRTFGPNGP